LICAIATFLSLKRESVSLRSRIRREKEETVAAVELLRATLLRLEGGLTELRTASEAIGAQPNLSANTGPSLNALRRGRILRMHYRGDPIEKIVAALGVPRREVELLLKVQKTSPLGLGASA